MNNNEKTPMSMVLVDIQQLERYLGFVRNQKNNLYMTNEQRAFSIHMYERALNAKQNELKKLKNENEDPTL
jgi:hypothetical protein